MLHSGVNALDGIVVEVKRKRVRRINLRVDQEGRVHLSIPVWNSSLREGEAFLRSQWEWVIKAVARMRKRMGEARTVTEEEEAAFVVRMRELHREWMARLSETDVECRFRRMKTVWGTCAWRKRKITYNLALAGKPQELAEYVVVHELTHLKEHNHGAGFYALMDSRLPNWRELRKRLR